jgi:hypothetical protein
LPTEVGTVQTGISAREAVYEDHNILASCYPHMPTVGIAVVTTRNEVVDDLLKEV